MKLVGSLSQRETHVDTTCGSVVWLTIAVYLFFQVVRTARAVPIVYERGK